MVAKENKLPKPLKISSVRGLDIGLKELNAEQKAGYTLEMYRKLTEDELATVQTRNQRHCNKRFQQRRLWFGDSVLLLVPTEQNGLTLAWRGPCKIVKRVGNDEYRVEISPGKVETYHINLLKKSVSHVGQGTGYVITQVERLTNAVRQPAVW